MAGRPKHPDKDIEAAVQYAASKNWTWTKAKSHAWGQLWCPLRARDGHRTSVNSTPKNGRNHADGIRRFVDRCKCVPEKEKPK